MSLQKEWADTERKPNDGGVTEASRREVFKERVVKSINTVER